MQPVNLGILSQPLERFLTKTEEGEAYLYSQHDSPQGDGTLCHRPVPRHSSVIDSET